MHFTVLKENLDKGLNIVGRILANRPQMPILSSFLLEVKDNKLNISSTNLELGIIYTIPVKAEKDGITAVPGKLLSEFISTLGADKIEFILEDSKLKVNAKKNHASFSTSNPADFPPFLQTDKPQKKLLIKKLKESIMRIVFAASNDEARPVLTGVKTTITKSKIYMVATDGYRLSKEEVDIVEEKDELETIIPAQSLNEIVRIAYETKADEIGFSIIEDKNQVVFYLPNVIVYTRLIDGEFPNIDKIIPQEFKTKIIVDKELFFQSVKTASLFARGAANIIKIKIEKEGLRLSANTPQIGENEDFIEAKIEGEETEIAFNYRFLLDLLTNFPDKEVVFETSGPLNPGVFKPKEPNIHFLHLIMPVRIQG